MELKEPILELKKTLTPDQAWHYRVVPKESSTHELVFYSDEAEANAYVKQELEILLGKRISFLVL